MLRGTLATAVVPKAATAGPAEFPLMLTARNGSTAPPPPPLPSPPLPPPPPTLPSPPYPSFPLPPQPRSNVVTLQIIAAQNDSREAIPGESVVDIVDYGPNPIEAGHPFNLQPDGTSAIWLRTSKAVPPGTCARLGGEELKTVLRGTLATAVVPKAATAGPAEFPLMLTARNGQPRSNVVTLQIIAAPDEKNARILEQQGESAVKDRRIKELEARAKRAEMRATSLATSRSWRITAPLRLLSSALSAMARLK